MPARHGPAACWRPPVMLPLKLGAIWAFGCCCSVQAAEMKAKIQALPEDMSLPPRHKMDIQVGLFFHHLRAVNDKAHTFSSKFSLVFRWMDGRNVSNLFSDSHLSESELGECSLTGMPSGGPALFTGPAQASRKYVELGADELSGLWMPDIRIFNTHESAPKVRSKTHRIYEDGLNEYTQVLAATLEMMHPTFALYPFDTQHLPIIVDSLSYSTERVNLHVLEELTGVLKHGEDAYPGWALVHQEAKVAAVAPDYSHKSPCRTERRSRATFDMYVSRRKRAVSGVILPTMLLVIISWGAFFITIKALMPRVTTAFMSFLTLTTWASQQASTLPAVNYLIWFTVFMNTCRFFVFLSLVETVIAQYLIDNVSFRLALSLDRFSRKVIPLNFLVVMLILAVHMSDAMIIIFYVHLVLIVAATIAYVLWQYRCLRILMQKDPLEAYGDGTIPLGPHELHILFHRIDTGGDGTITAEELVRHCRHKWHQAPDTALQPNELELIKDIRTRLVEPITIEAFRAQQAEVFFNLRRLCLITRMSVSEDEQATAPAQASDGANDAEGEHRV
mmetsp:Transcript_55239/g.124441  ORF Transcript_55239/g.124441 Transcript_55239/m.124441 type:complete len:561 (-) Transcript_55239:47-1729(-)